MKQKKYTVTVIVIDDHDPDNDGLLETLLTSLNQAALQRRTDIAVKLVVARRGLCDPFTIYEVLAETCLANARSEPVIGLAIDCYDQTTHKPEEGLLLARTLGNSSHCPKDPTLLEKVFALLKNQWQTSFGQGSKLTPPSMGEFVDKGYRLLKGVPIAFYSTTYRDDLTKFYPNSQLFIREGRTGFKHANEILNFIVPPQRKATS